MTVLCPLCHMRQAQKCTSQQFRQLSVCSGCHGILLILLFGFQLLRMPVWSSFRRCLPSSLRHSVLQHVFCTKLVLLLMISLVLLVVSVTGSHGCIVNRVACLSAQYQELVAVCVCVCGGWDLQLSWHDAMHFPTNPEPAIKQVDPACRASDIRDDAPRRASRACIPGAPAGSCVACCLT